MYYHPKTLFLVLFLFTLFSQQTFALGEAISNFADKVGKEAKEVGHKVSEEAKEASQSAGIGTTAAEIDQGAYTALDKLYQTTPAAVKLSKKAKAILIFPKILKAGMGVGGQHGEGALRKHGKTVAYYNTIAGSYGLQLGAQSFGYAMFFMNDEALGALINSNKGWEVGVGPSIVMVDEGLAKTLTTASATESVYVFIFNQKGLMAGMGIQGSKITRITPEK